MLSPKTACTLRSYAGMRGLGVVLESWFSRDWDDFPEDREWRTVDDADDSER